VGIELSTLAVDGSRPVAPIDSRPAPPAIAIGSDRKQDVRDAAGPSGADNPARHNPSDDDSGWVGVNEALYRLRSNWSPASHAGANAIVSLPRPDVIAAYHHSEQAKPLDAEAAAAAAATHRDLVV
jgi:hypothetical protein